MNEAVNTTLSTEAKSEKSFPKTSKLFKLISILLFTHKNVLRLEIFDYICYASSLRISIKLIMSFKFVNRKQTILEI